jgi:GrpB-like predicted nucleotidyltransferase (UPF0157 family)
VITVVPYDSTWPTTFAVIRERLALALDGVPATAIEHVGSTAVPGLWAKPVIDVDIVVAPAHVAAASDALQAVGFSPHGNLGIEHRWAFGAPPDWPPLHAYVVLDGSLALRNHLAVRDALRAHPDLRAAYSTFKQRLATEADDMATYVEAKSPLLRQILRRAGFTDEELAQIEDANRA